jgi:hypothetical protein
LLNLPNLLFIIKKSTILKTARIIPIKISQSAFGPEPITIGIGPIKITIPTLLEELAKTTEATTKTTMPMKTKAIPKIKKPRSLLETAIPSSSGSWELVDMPVYLNNQ